MCLFGKVISPTGTVDLFPEMSKLWHRTKPSHLWDPSVHFRHALDIREHYERKLESANNLYMELNALMLQLELKERELLR